MQWFSDSSNNNTSIKQHAHTSAFIKQTMKKRQLNDQQIQQKLLTK